MKLLNDQLDLELEMINGGRERYYSSTIEAESGDRGCDTSYSKRLIPEYFIPLVCKINSWIESTHRGWNAKYKVLLNGINAEELAWFTLRSVFNALMTEQSVTSVCSAIGLEIESEHKFRRLKEEYPFLLKHIQSDIKRMNTQSTEHIRQTLSTRLKKYDIVWESWSYNERIQIGAVLLRCFQECSDIITIRVQRVKNKRLTVLSPSDSCIDWIIKHQEKTSLLHPVFLPCICPPNEWKSLEEGGYYQRLVQERVPFVKGLKRGGKQNYGDCSRMMRAANHLGKTPWRVNKFVFSTLQDVWKNNLGCGLPVSKPLEISGCPVEGVPKEHWTEEDKNLFVKWKREANIVHRLEKSRIGECILFSRILNTAHKMKDYSALYFPVQLDFRGRMYTTTSAFSYQGPDYSKAVLEFANDSILTDDEAYKWFLIHGANSYGFDKISYSERIVRIRDMHSEILQVGADPLGCTGFWGNSDSPWQFLAWCREYTELHKKGSKAFRTRIPVGLDGSCNGIQHYSGMLRDEVGGASTNLSPRDVPSDVYSDVSEVVARKLRLSDSDYAKRWIDYGITRKLTKKPVMTLPYGATRQNCTLSICSYAVENGLFRGEEFQAALFLSPIVWEAIEETVIKARQAMDWLKQVALIACHQQLPVQWITPEGFHVHHAQYKHDAVEIRTILHGVKKLTVGKPTSTLQSHKQANGVAPNFVHSLDSSHLCSVVNRMKDIGIHDIGTVHDCYTTHANNVATLGRVIREEFVRMYTEHNPLMELYERMGENISLPDPPEMGTLDLNCVLDSEYFFH